MNSQDGSVEYDDLDGVMPPAQNPCLYGHDRVVVLLEQMLAENHIHHALLFEGPQGVGKATLGFHLAAYMLDNKGFSISFEGREGGGLREIDESAADWRQIAARSHPGFLYISRPFDSKAQKFRTTITVEEIRKVTHFLHQTAAGNGWRIVMIDSVDDMNRNGANALLKTLEEPPPRALFILISHHKGRLLATLRSRCQALAFKPLDERQLYQALSHVANGLGLDTESEDSAKIIQAAEGSVRKALLMLQFGGLDIAQAIEDILQTEKSNIPEMHHLASALAAKDAEPQFAQFIDCLLRFVGKKASHAALCHDRIHAERLACLYQQLSDDIVAARAYNLDKKHFILVLLNKVHGIFFA